MNPIESDDEAEGAILYWIFTTKEFGQCYWDARLGRLLQHLPQINDPTLIVLKGHLLIEEILEDLLKVKCIDAASLKDVDISFYLKLRLAKALNGSKLDDGFELPPCVWECAEALNSLRNELAHSLEGAAVDRKMERFISLAFHNGKRPTNFANKADELRRAISILHAYLSSFEAAAKITAAAAACDA